MKLTNIRSNALDYKKIHDNIINRALITEEVRADEKTNGDVYYEKHHIKPRCMGGTDEKDNLVFLTAREHFIVHLLLCKIHIDEPKDIRAKLASAVSIMRRQPSKDSSLRVKSSRMFELARLEFIRNHPTKTEEVRAKISKTLKEKERPPKQEKEMIDFTCACGCGKVSTKILGSSQMYIVGHNPVDPEKISKGLKNALSKMTESDMKKRMKNSAGSCDHKKRGEKISQGKKGKPTNQQKIMGERFAKMNDKEFETYLSSKKDNGKHVRKRFTNLREKYINENSDDRRI